MMETDCKEGDHTRGLEGDGEDGATGSLGSGNSQAGISGGLAQNQAAFLPNRRSVLFHASGIGFRVVRRGTTGSDCAHNPTSSCTREACMLCITE